MAFYAMIDNYLRPVGMMSRGGLRACEADARLPQAATIVLVGHAGLALWQAFSRDVEANERQRATHPLDTWTRRVLSPIAASLGARVVFPFDGPPFHPFQAWAHRAERLAPSPVGPLAHPDFGLWHAYRGAFIFDAVLPLPVSAAAAHPCAVCEEKPCLIACPVGAIVSEGPNVSRCIGHLRGEAGRACMDGGCRARDACPVGIAHRYPEEQVRFHMQRFVSDLGP